jgi:hypothetical protein
MIQNKLLSAVGLYTPKLKNIEWPRQLLKGQKIDEWTIPFNFKADVFDCFNTFNLWVSSNGLMAIGKKHVSLSSGNMTATTLEPVLVGDFIDGRPIIKAENSYQNLKNMWLVKFEVGTPPKENKPQEIEIAYLRKMYQTKVALKEATSQLVDDLFTKVLPLCTAGVNPIVIAPALTTMQLIKQEFNAAVDKALKQEEDEKWTF